MAAERPSNQAEWMQCCNQARNLHQPHRKDHRMDKEHSWKQPNVRLSVEPSEKQQIEPSTSPSRKNILCQFCKNFCKIKWNRNQISSRKQKFLSSTILSELCIFKWNYLKLDVVCKISSWMDKTKPSRISQVMELKKKTFSSSPSLFRLITNCGGLWN